ncbi:MAG: hypothetical protein N3A58_06665 [Spirochaetes bacterium]|nr:hypothetical protein [Spirochaetota bacterium]
MFLLNLNLIFDPTYTFNNKDFLNILFAADSLKDNPIKENLFFQIDDIINNSGKIEFNYLINMLFTSIKEILNDKDFLFKGEFEKLFAVYIANLIEKLDFNKKSDIELFENINIDFIEDIDFNFKLKYLDEKEINKNKDIVRFLRIDIEYDIVNKSQIENLNKIYKNIVYAESIINEKGLLLKIRLNYLNKEYEKELIYLLPFDHIKIYNDINNFINYYLIKDITGIKYYKFFIKSKEDYFIKANDLILGKTNNLYYLKEGKYTLEVFNEGYESLIDNIDLNFDYIKEVELKKRDKKSRITIYVYPESSDVFINNNYIGKSPIIDYETYEGIIYLHISSSNFEHYQSTFVIKSEEKKILKIFLKPKNYTTYFINYSNLYYQKAINYFKITGIYFLVSLISFSIANNYYDRHLSFGEIKDYTNYLIFLNMGYLFFIPTVYFLIEFYYNLYLYSNFYKNYLQ